MNYRGWNWVSGSMLLLALTCSARAQSGGPTTSMISPREGATVNVASPGSPNMVWQSSGWGTNTIKETWIQIDNGPVISSVPPPGPGTSSGGFGANAPLSTYVNGPHTVQSYVKVLDGTIAKSTVVNFTLTGSSATTPPGGGDVVTTIDPALLAKLNAALAEQGKLILSLFQVQDARQAAQARYIAAVKELDAQVATARNQPTGPSTVGGALSALSAALSAVQSANAALAAAQKAVTAINNTLRTLEQQAGVALTGSSTQAALQRKQLQIVLAIISMGDVLINLQEQANAVSQGATELANAQAAASQALATAQANKDRVSMQSHNLAILFYGNPLGPSLKSVLAVFNTRITDASAQLKKLQAQWGEATKALQAASSTSSSGF